jgi:transcription elongation factor GreB
MLRVADAAALETFGAFPRHIIELVLRPPINDEQGLHARIRRERRNGRRRGALAAAGRRAQLHDARRLRAAFRRARAPGAEREAGARRHRAWAAGNGDRSENGDYIYGKKRLREIDRRIRFLIKRLDAAEVVDPAAPREEETAGQVFFGATVDVRNARGEPRTVSIVGVDEIDTARGYISWVSPMARALLKAREGDTVTLRTPAGAEEIDIVEVRYAPLATGPEQPS